MAPLENILVTPENIDYCPPLEKILPTPMLHSQMLSIFTNKFLQSKSLRLYAVALNG